ncbi:MAG: YeeE/YedE family protein [Ignavibacteria bacterium]|jgi:rhodanese-related sulfurtransferase|nr:YeeE/YedE family protein [Ignavibacteria bacterium]
MGPLVPDIIGNDLNFIVALVIGILFGMILEQAGFSTSKKLVGLFYGYDFTVLRVFFTAGVTAMVGVIALAHFGLLDMNLIYINPTFLTSAIVGGLIMGLGFVIGGFCPGTSVCAAAIGKIDAIVFVIGAYLGVLIFAETYPLWEELYFAQNLGNPQLFSMLGISQSLFAFLFVLIALFAFFFVSIIENKANGIKEPAIRFTPYYISIAVVGFALAISAFFFPNKKESLLKESNNQSILQSYELDYISVDELSCRLMSDDKRIQIFDFRSSEEYEKQPLPKSTLFTIENLFEKEPSKLLHLRHKKNILIGSDELEAKRIGYIAKELGFKNIRVLKGGFAEFQKSILDFAPASALASNDVSEKDIYRFRFRASQRLPLLIKESKPSGAVKKTQKRIVGGC